jgi:hypothetical protein
MTCAHCGREPGHGSVMIIMQPQTRGGDAWALCWPCYRPEPVVTRRGRR